MGARNEPKSSATRRKPLIDKTNQVSKKPREGVRLKSHNHNAATKEVLSEENSISAKPGDNPNMFDRMDEEEDFRTTSDTQMVENLSSLPGTKPSFQRGDELDTTSDVQMTEPAAQLNTEVAIQQEASILAPAAQETAERPESLTSYTKLRSSGGPVRHGKKGGRNCFDPLASGGRNSRSNNLMDQARVDLSNGLNLSLAEFETAPTIVAEDTQQSHQNTTEDSASPEINPSSPESREVSTNTSVSEDAVEVSDHVQLDPNPAPPSNIVAVEELPHVTNSTQDLQPLPSAVEVADPWNPIWAASRIHTGLFKPVWINEQAPGLDTVLNNQARVELFKTNQGDNHDRVLRNATLQESDQLVEEYECIWVAILLGWPSWKFLTVDEREMAEVAASDDDDDKSWAPDLDNKSHDDRLKMFGERKGEAICKAVPGTVFDTICEKICFKWGWPHPRTLTTAERDILESSEDVKYLVRKDLKMRVKEWETRCLKAQASVKELKGLFAACMAEYFALGQDYNSKHGRYNNLKNQIDAIKPIWWDNANWDMSNRFKLAEHIFNSLMELDGKVRDALLAVNNVRLPMAESKDASDKASEAYSVALSKLTQLQADQSEFAKEARSNGFDWEEVSSLKQNDIKPTTKVGARKRKWEAEEIVEVSPATATITHVVAGSDVQPGNDAVNDEVSARPSKKQKTTRPAGEVTDAPKLSNGATVAIDDKVSDVAEQSKQEAANKLVLSSAASAGGEEKTKASLIGVEGIPGLGLLGNNATDVTEESKSGAALVEDRNARPSDEEPNPAQEVAQEEDSPAQSASIVTQEAAALSEQEALTTASEPPAAEQQVSLAQSDSIVVQGAAALSQQEASTPASEPSAAEQQVSPAQTHTTTSDSNLRRAVGRTPPDLFFRSQDLDMLRELQGLTARRGIVPITRNGSAQDAIRYLQKGKRSHQTFSDEDGWSAETQSNKVFLDRDANDSQPIERIQTDIEPKTLNTTPSDSHDAARMTTTTTGQSTSLDRWIYFLGDRLQQQTNHIRSQFAPSPFQGVPTLPGLDESDLIE